MHRKSSGLLCLVLSLLSLSPAQPTRYLVYFQPKPDSLLPFVEAYLSPEALRRRYQQGIPIDAGDLPVPSAWIAQLGQHGRVMGVSRWLNAALVEVPVSSALPAAPFIRCVEPFTAAQPRHKIPQESITGATHQLISSLGASAWTGSLTATQLSMLHIPELHDRNLRGRGIRVAVLDAGFPGINQIAAFQHVFGEGRYVAGYDFVSGDSLVFDDNSHGTMVASIILGQDDTANYVGGAPEIELILARTEDAVSETRQEEWNWARAAEWADSLGAYIIQSSLGYSTFDDPAENYTYADMNGQTAIVTLAARTAARKGLLVVSSAGNEGGSAWRYITAPADADSIIAVGAVDVNGQITFFSSRGPAADGRIKPDVVALGQGVSVIRPNGTVGGGAGTSFAAPLITSLAACLWQAQPTLHAQTLRQIILESSDRYANPDTAYGYGLPNGALALARLTTLTQNSSAPTLKVFPNPTREDVSLVLPDTTLSWYTLTICDATGRQVYSTPYRGLTLLTLPTATWRSGLYWIHLHHQQNPKQTFQTTFIKL